MLALLDLDDTLVDKTSAFRLWARQLVSEHHLGPDSLTWLTQTDRRLKQRALFFAEVAHQFPHLGSAQALWDTYVRMMPDLVKPFPGVLGELARLRGSGVRLVVVTNGRTANQTGKLRATGVADLVDCWVISESVGVRKPDIRIYQAALKMIGSPDPREVWMVGDDPDLDIAPASRLEMKTIWVSHEREWSAGHPAPTQTARTPALALAELAREL